MNLEVLRFDFEWFSSDVHCVLETKTVSNLLSSPTVTSQVLFPTVIRQFSRPLYDYEG